MNYFHIQHNGTNEGWVYVKKQYPIILTHKAITDYGYYSGIVNKVEEQIKKHPRLFINFDKCENSLPPQPIAKQKPEITDKLITFKNAEIIGKLHNELKGFFTNKEAELLKALQGEQLKELLLFPHNQNKLVELLKRIKYNGFLINTPKEIENWICSNFSYQYQKGNKKEVRNFKNSTVHDILTKDKGEPTKNERICMLDWLPYKSHLTRQRETQNEKL